MKLPRYINGNGAKCRDCKYYVPWEKRKPPDWDGECHNTKRNRRLAHKDVTFASGFVSACFDAEAPDETETKQDGQMDWFDMEMLDD